MGVSLWLFYTDIIDFKTFMEMEFGENEIKVGETMMTPGFKVWDLIKISAHKFIIFTGSLASWVGDSPLYGWRLFSCVYTREWMY